MFKKAPMINTNDCPGPSSPGSSGACTWVGQTTQLVWTVNELPTGEMT